MYKTTEITSADIASDNPVHQRLLFPYTEAAKIVSGNVLEIGCGWGRGLHLLTEAADQYTGIDKNAELIEAVIPNERYSQLQIKEGDTLLVRPRRLHVFVDQGASI